MAKLQQVLGYLNEVLGLLKNWNDESELPSWFEELVAAVVPKASTRAQIMMMAPILIEGELAPAVQKEPEKVEELRVDLENAIGALERVIRTAF